MTDENITAATVAQPLQKPDPSLAVQTFNLSRIFGGLVAVGGIDIGVKKGELFAFLGPNGAGKTTTINMLCCLLKPTGGTASVMGHDIIAEPYEVKKLIGVSPQTAAFSERLTPLENLELIANLHGLGAARAIKWSKLMLETMGLEDRAGDHVRKLSGGMRRRLSIAMALIHDPQVLVLDEPTLGLDSQSRRIVWEYIARLKGEKTILLATHYMEEADALADCIGIMYGGRIMAVGSPLDFKTGMLDKHTLVVKGWNITQSAMMDIKRRYADVRVEGGTIYITDSRIEFADVVNRLQNAGISLRSAYFKEPTLEDVFTRITGKELGE
jgi:ABC-2 type transport system ATP-binding protein